MPACHVDILEVIYKHIFKMLLFFSIACNISMEGIDPGNDENIFFIILMVFVVHESFKEGWKGMAIETTMYIHETTMRLIKEACALTCIKRNAMIVQLMKYAMSDSKKSIRTGCRVRYQSRDSRDKWQTIHVRFREDEADYAKDLRNFLKLSDSLIIALAVREYINEIIKKSRIGEKHDNYRFSHYYIAREEIHGLITWTIYWGYPPNPGRNKEEPQMT